MTHTTHPEADGAWPGQDHYVPVPDTSMLPGTEKAPPAAVELLQRVVQGAHASIDRLADSAVPAVRELSERVSSTEASVQAKAASLRQAGDAWSSSLRGTVRTHPLASVAAAAALGALIALVTRPRR